MKKLDNSTNLINYNGYSISKRGNGWYLYINKVGDMEKPYRESLHTADEKDACAKAKEIFKQIMDEHLNKTSSQFGFIPLVEEFLKENTYVKHREYMNRCFIPYFGRDIKSKAKINDIRKITHTDIGNYIKYRRSIKSRNSKGQEIGNIVKNTTIKREIQTLKAFFKWCYNKGLLSKPIEFPEIRDKEQLRDENGNDIFEDLSGKRDAFSNDEVNKLFSTALSDIAATVNQFTKRRKKLQYTYIFTLNETGIRTCELRELKWSCFTVLADGSGTFYNVYSKKKKDKRDVAVSPEAVKELLKLKKEQQEFCQKHNIPFNENEVYIISLCNENVSKNKYELVRVKEFDNGFRNLMDKCGIEHKNKKTLYSFRHTYISRLIEKGVPVKNIASQCGTSIEMIEKFYDNKNSHMANREWLFVA